MPPCPLATQGALRHNSSVLDFKILFMVPTSRPDDRKARFVMV